MKSQLSYQQPQALIIVSIVDTTGRAHKLSVRLVRAKYACTLILVADPAKKTKIEALKQPQSQTREALNNNNDRQTERRTDRQADIQSDRQTDRQPDRQA